MQEEIYNVDWYGPYPFNKIDEKVGTDRTLVLYALYGPHTLYGSDVLLYLGMTEKTLRNRLSQHEPWIKELANKVNVFAAAIGKFKSWKDAENTSVYSPLNKKEISAIESLLILAHQPVYNSRSRQTAEAAKNIRIFNTGKYGSMLPEVSGLYHMGG